MSIAIANFLISALTYLVIWAAIIVFVIGLTVLTLFTLISLWRLLRGIGK